MGTSEREAIGADEAVKPFAAILLLLAASASAFAQGTNIAVIVSPPVTERFTNAPLVIATFSDPEPCPVCHGASHHEFQLVRMSAFDTVKQTTEVGGQKKTHVVYVGPTTNWVATNVVRRVYNRSASPGWPAGTNIPPLTPPQPPGLP